MFKYLKIIGLIIFMVVEISCDLIHKGSDTYTVVFPNLPPKISVQKSDVSVVYYILKQTHEPLFRNDDGENYHSNVLQEWSRTLNNKEFKFCPNNNLKFNKKDRFDINYFYDYINNVTRKFDNRFSLNKEKGCVIIKFYNSHKKYLDFLTYYENAPSVKRTESIEDGLGKFYVEKLTPKIILLKRKTEIKNGYNIIIIEKFNPGKNYKTNKDYDFNLIASFNWPEWIKEKYQKFETIELRTVVLIINHPEKKVRKQVYNCIDIPKLRKNFYPGNKNFVDIKNILPLGIKLSKYGLPVQNCTKNEFLFQKPLIFANWRSDNKIKINAFMSDFCNKSGLKVEIKEFKPEELVKNFDEDRKKFNLVIVVIDATKNDPLSFFEPFFYKRRFYDQELFVKNKKLKSDRYNINTVELLNILEKEFLVLPLYQSINQLYYPKYIKNVILGRDFLQYPEIAEFRW